MSSEQRVLITAGARGIGLAIASSFRASGADVLICDIDKASLAAAMDLLPGVRGEVVDVASDIEVRRLFETMSANCGGIDVLVNNAGIGGPNAPLEEVEPHDWRRSLDVNLSGAFYCIREAARFMKSQRSGCIINISTPSAIVGLPNRAPYVASKAGLLGLTYNVAREYGPWNIRCNAILPGAVDNERGRRVLKDVAERANLSLEEAERNLLRHISMRTWIQPSEIGEVAVFLASNAGRHITGQRIGVDGNVEWEE
jgi:NAD(P)-dependent dehydrogenase (short-subunit alcohol dehydrogenase family)